MRRTPLRRKTPLRATSIQRKPPQKPRRAIGKGKRTLEWEAARRELKIAFAAAGITACERRGPGCWGDNALGFAHTRKRRFIITPEQLTEVALLCCVCHDAVENTPEIVRQIIVNRPVAVVL